LPLLTVKLKLRNPYVVSAERAAVKKCEVIVADGVERVDVAPQVEIVKLVTVTRQCDPLVI
jgi:hypothetical protein